MKRTSEHSSSEGVSPFAAAAAGIGAVALVTMAVCPALLPFSILAIVPFYKLARAESDHGGDYVAAEQADRLAETWKRSRRPGERGITVSASVRKGGGLLNETVTRTYRYELDDDEL